MKRFFLFQPLSFLLKLTLHMLVYLLQFLLHMLAYLLQFLLKLTLHMLVYMFLMLHKWRCSPSLNDK